jgi:ElaA protein
MTIDIDVTDDTATCFRLRHTVFVEEQGVPVEEEIDALDATATHLMARADGRPVGTARIVFADGTAKIGRVCVLAEARGAGTGAALIRAAMQIARETPGIGQARLGAQVTAIGFYEALGFRAEGPVYLDAGIEHRDMAAPL